MTERRCRTCDEVLPLLAFPKSGCRDGVQMRRSDCKRCVSAEMRALRGPTTRAHYENVTKGERCPHGGGTRKFAWVGYRG